MLNCGAYLRSVQKGSGRVCSLFAWRYEMDYDEICYECTGYGDDYYFDEDGELVSACSECPFREKNK